jgi:predicted RNA-binding protein YlqC (UPF0109 family)
MSTNITIDQQFIEYIVKSLVSNPDAVSIERRIDEKGVLLELTVDPEDLGRVIGKRGATAQSLRTLLRALGTKQDARYNLKIVDTGDSQSHSRSYDRLAEDTPAEERTSDSEYEERVESAEQPVDEPSTEAEPEVSAVETSDDEEEIKEAEEKAHSDRISEARKELADLDDLDV